MASNGLRDRRLWLEAFILVNLGFLGPDIYLAHTKNAFRHPVELVPLAFSLLAPWPLLVGLIAWRWRQAERTWRWLGFLVGWTSIVIGVAGLVYHLESHFFQEGTLASLVYCAPFAAPLAYTGLGLLLLLNRLVPADSADWPLWVLLLALGGFVGNFIFSLTDHAQIGFYHGREWIPVISSGFAHKHECWLVSHDCATRLTRTHPPCSCV